MFCAFIREKKKYPSKPKHVFFSSFWKGDGNGLGQRMTISETNLPLSLKLLSGFVKLVNCIASGIKWLCANPCIERSSLLRSGNKRKEVLPQIFFSPVKSVYKNPVLYKHRLDFRPAWCEIKLHAKPNQRKSKKKNTKIKTK